MLTFKIPSHFGVWIAAKYRWMADLPLASDAFGFAHYFHCRDTREHHGFHREVKFTKIIDLRPSRDEILRQFSGHTRTKIKHGAHDGMRFSSDIPEEELLKVCALFAEDNGLPELEKKVLDAYWSGMKVTKLSRDNRTLVMHSFIIDESTGRACMLHDAAMFRRADDLSNRNTIGHANRYLHYLDMLYLKDLGVQWLDLGGYARDTTDEHLQRVNEFKDGFGGELVEMSNYVSLPLFCYRKLSHHLHRGNSLEGRNLPPGPGVRALPRRFTDG